MCMCALFKPRSHCRQGSVRKGTQECHPSAAWSPSNCTSKNGEIKKQRERGEKLGTELRTSYRYQVVW